MPRWVDEHEQNKACLESIWLHVKQNVYDVASYNHPIDKRPPRVHANQKLRTHS